MQALLIENLTKKFGEFTAVDGISFKVKQGEIFGFLGPNGAGKTTTINMLSTLLKKTSGFAEVAGFDISKDRNNVRKSIGIVFQEPALDSKLTGRENLDLHSMLYFMKRDERKKKMAEVLELVELSDRADILVEKYSGGMKRRLEIARGLIHDPQVLFLDEPTLGLDTQTRRKIWEYIKELNRKKNVTIILTTHYMEEANFLCDRIAIIDGGRIVVTGTPNSLKNSLGGDVISLEISGNSDDFLFNLKKCRWVNKIKRHNGHVSLSVKKGEKRIPELLRLSQKSKAEVVSVSLRKPSLDDVFIHFTGKTIREDEASANERNLHAMRGRMGHRR